VDPKEIVRRGYESISAAYLARRRQDAEDMLVLQELIQRLPEGAKVLDAGCGAGVPVAKALSERFDVTGVDFAEGQLRLARELVPNATFICGDMTKLDLPDESFDAVVSYYAIIHIPRTEHRRFLRRLWRMLRGGGLALLCMGADDIPGETFDDYMGAPMYWSHFDEATNLRMLEESGFEVLLHKIVPDDPGRHLFVLASKTHLPDGSSALGPGETADRH